MTSIRTFLIGVSIATFLLFTSIAVLQGFVSAERASLILLDEHLADMAHLLLVVDKPSNQQRKLHANIAYEVSSAAGGHRRSDNLPDAYAMPFTEGYGWANFNDARWRSFTAYDASEQTWVRVFEPKLQRDLVAEQAAMSVIIPIVLALPIAAFVIWMVIGVGLKPLLSLSQVINTKDADDLSPIVVNPLPVELQPLLDNTNALLAKLERSFAKEKHFIAEASHELRSPISALKVQLHNLAHEFEHLEDFEALRLEVDNLARLIDQLLDLSKNNVSSYRTSFEPLDLRKLAEDECARMYQRVEDKAQLLELCATAVTCPGHPLGVRTLLANLLENAIKYSPVGGAIRVTVAQTGPWAVLAIEDSGPGISPAKRHRVRERFYRIQDSAEAIEGAGLGLSIVDAIVAQHNGRIHFAQEKVLRGLAVTVELPMGTDV